VGVSAMWDLATPTSDKSPRNAEDRVLESPCMYHLSY
jgi:hypothetical protein